MPTTFILHGGFGSDKAGKDTTDFYKAILKHAPENARILLVPFAKDPERIPAAIEKVSAAFNEAGRQKNVTIKAANENTFIEQLKTADVAYFHGGVSLKLLEALKKYPELKEAVEGKIIAGESAGANVWCKYFYSPQADDVFEGLGFLPYKIIPHYKKEYEGKLEGYGQSLEELLLPEYEYRIFSI